MRLHLLSNYQAMSAAAASALRQFVSERPNALLGLATGDSPLGLYTKLRGSPGAQAQFARARFIQLDEWAGLPSDHPATCESYLRREWLEPLQIGDERYYGWRVDPEVAGDECARMRQVLRDQGPMDACVLGLGLNGHLAFNEPGEVLSPNAHRATLSATSLTHSMLHATDAKPAAGLSLGMADILHAGRIFLLVSGLHKASQLERLFTEEISTSFPASLLWLHRQVDVYADFDAARNLNEQTRNRFAVGHL